MFAHLPRDLALNAIWKSWSLPILKVFAWLLMHDHLNTRDLMLRKNLHLDSGSDCVLCTASLLETRDHLFFLCPFAQQCWAALGIQWDTSISISHRFVVVRLVFIGPCFMEVVSYATWNIWKERNDLIFKN